MTTPERINFETVKVDRGRYFVKYCPAHPNLPISNLQVVFPGATTPEVAASAMESEVKHWISRFPVPVMAYAYGPNGDECGVETVRSASVLTGFTDEHGVTELHWGIVDDAMMPQFDFSTASLKVIYAALPQKSATELYRLRVARVQRARMRGAVLFILTVVIPLSVIVLEWASELIGTVVAVCCFIGGVWAALRMSGWVKKSRRQIDKEADELQRDHHHYHCLKNPEGFRRLRDENFTRDEREDIQAEAAAIKGQLGSHRVND